MTRATRFAFAAVWILAALACSPLVAQNNQPVAGQTNPASRYTTPAGQPAQPQPARTPIYGPAVAPGSGQPQQSQPQRSAYQVQPAAGQLNAGEAQPAVAQQPIRQPAGNAVAPVNVGPNGINPLNVPKVQVVQPAPLQPKWYPLDPKVQEWVDRVLAYWEQRSNQVKTLECTFQKWEYDPSYVPTEFNQLKALGRLHELPFSKYAEGKIKYGAPDKGLFKVEKLQVIVPGQQQASKPKYELQAKENGEHWVTDGKRVFAFDAVRKELIESVLPPEMQGKALADGPLPFMFGARAETIKARYWIRPLPAEAKGEYCLEAVPKSRQDAANFKMVQIVLDEKQYLPTKMQIFEGDWSPNNPHRTAYRFDNRIENDPKTLAMLLDPLGLWNREFYEVKTPTGWRRVVRDADGNIVGPGGANTATAPSIDAPKPR